MKSIFTLLSLSVLLGFYAKGQTFFPLTTDPAGDQTQSVNDVERFNVAYDTAKDSIWFRIDFHNPVSSDFGFVFGLDTDLMPSTGANAWNGVQTGLQCDEIIIINRNSIAPTFFYGSSTYGNLGELTTQPNDTSILVAMKLSRVDADGSFNIIMGSGFFDAALTNRQVYDEAPTSGWVSVSPTVDIEPFLTEDDINIQAQASSGFVTISVDSWEKLKRPSLSLINLEGRVVKKLAMNQASNTFAVAELPSGLYVIVLEDGQASLSKKIHIIR